MPSAPSQKCQLHPLCYRMLLQSSSTTWSYLDLDLPALADLGPFTEAIVPHTWTENFEGPFAWKVVLYYSMDAKNWSGPEDLFTVITAAEAYTIKTNFSSTNKLGLKIRVALAYRSTTTDTRASAVVSAALVFQLLT